MKRLITKIDPNQRPLPCSLDAVKLMLRNEDEWTLTNDMIRDAKIMMDDHGFLALDLSFESGIQSFGLGYRSEGNIGIMILWLARLLGVSKTREEYPKALIGTPIRLFYRTAPGESWGDNLYIGHFMKDSFIRGRELVTAGILDEVLEDDE